MTTTDPLAEAVEAAARHNFKRGTRSNVAWEDIQESDRSAHRAHVRLLVEAAAPLLREQTLAPIRALADEWKRRADRAAWTEGRDSFLAMEKTLRAALGDPA